MEYTIKVEEVTQIDITKVVKDEEYKKVVYKIDATLNDLSFDTKKDADKVVSKIIEVIDSVLIG